MVKDFFICLFVMVVGTTVWAKPFQMTIRGPARTIKTFQKQAELKMARSIDFCRGFTMPGKIGKWRCKRVGEGNTQCQVQYECRLIRKDFSRVTETRRIRHELKNLPPGLVKFEVSVSKEPIRIPKFSSRVAVAANRLSKLQKLQKSKSSLREKNFEKSIKPSVNKVQKVEEEYDEFAELERELNIQKVDDLNEQKAVDGINRRGLVRADRRKKEVDQIQPGFEAEISSSDDGRTKLIKVQKKDIRPANQQENTAFYRLLTFEASMIKVVDQNENSVGTSDVAWTPWWSWNERWRLKGHFGGHYLTAFVGSQRETFLTYDIVGKVDYHLWKSIHLEAGLGVQKWGSSAGGSFSTKTIGASWNFKPYKFKFVDKFFISMNWVSNDDNNTETKVGVGLSF